MLEIERARAGGAQSLRRIAIVARSCRYSSSTLNLLELKRAPTLSGRWVA
jgi:hypothetical protein